MQININNAAVDWNFEIAEKYLPVKLGVIGFHGIGECIAFVANRPVGNRVGTNVVLWHTEIGVYKDSEVFVTLKDNGLYNEIAYDIQSFGYWIPSFHTYTVKGLVDGVSRVIHLDRDVFY